jgi:excisionase family DNA binding protein
VRTQLEPEDIQAIGDYILERLTPIVTRNGKHEPNDTIFDVPALCEYLHVTPKWIHEQTHLKKIPYYKLSNKQLRFRKKDVDKWLESRKTPAVNDLRERSKAVN